MKPYFCALLFVETQKVHKFAAYFKHVKMNRIERLEYSRSYQLCKSITYLMDKCYIDPLLGLIPILDFVVGVGCTAVFIYVSLVKVRSISLTLAVIYNFLRDTVIGLVPVIGDVADFFNRSYVRSQRLIEGFVYGDKQVIKKVNGQAGKMLLLSVVSTILIVILCYLAIQIGSFFFDYIKHFFETLFMIIVSWMSR